MTLRIRPLSLAFAAAAALSAPAFAGSTQAAFDTDATVAGQPAGVTAAPAPVTVQPAPSGYVASPASSPWMAPNMSAGPVYGGVAGEVRVFEPNGVTSSVNNPAFDSEDQIAGRPVQQPAVVDGRLWGNPAFDSDDTVAGSAVPGSPSQSVLPR